MQNGLYFDEYKDFLGTQFSNKDLKRFGIKLRQNDKIIFSWGRCSIAKGFKELALAWSKTYKELPNHHLILQMPNNSGETDYFNEVRNILENTERFIIIDDFNPSIWKSILRNRNTDIVCIPSLMDPFPHTSIEAKLFSKNMNYLTVISDVDGAVDAFTKEEAIRADPKDIDNFSQKILDTINMSGEDKRKMIDNNESTVDNFNFSKIINNFINVNIQ